MTWLALLLLAAVVLAPLGWVLARRAPVRGTRELAVALHRQQLLDLDRDLADGRIAPAEHAAAVLEVQRRLLAAAGTEDMAATPGGRFPLALALGLVPAAALVLYIANGQPGMPSLTPALRRAVLQRQAEENALIAQLRTRLQAMDPKTEQARQGYLLLGNVEETRGNDAAAAAAWGRALQSRFDPVLAVRAAEAATRAQGGVSGGSAALFQRALDAAPPDAPWRAQVEARLKEPRIP